MLEELCKRIQHCCATLRRSWNKRNVGSCWLKSLTGFKLCAITRNNIQQDVQTDETCNIQHCWEFLRACWHWCANRCNNFQQCWDLQCIEERIQPITLCKPHVMSVRGPNSVGRAVQTDPTLFALRFGNHETKEALGVVGWKVWPVSNFAQQHATTCNRVCKRTQHVTSNNVGSCWATMLRPFARSLISKRLKFHYRMTEQMQIL